MCGLGSTCATYEISWLLYLQRLHSSDLTTMHVWAFGSHDSLIRLFLLLLGYLYNYCIYKFHLSIYRQNALLDTNVKFKNIFWVLYHLLITTLFCATSKVEPTWCHISLLVPWVAYEFRCCPSDRCSKGKEYSACCGSSSRRVHRVILGAFEATPHSRYYPVLVQRTHRTSLNVA